MIKVYIAGAMRDPNPITFLENIRKGILMGATLVANGYAPFCPMLDNQYFMQQLSCGDIITTEKVMNVSTEWLRQCDVVLVLPGWKNSVGTRNEIEEADRIGIPVFFSVNTMHNHFKREGQI